MQRNLETLTQQAYDLVIIGGGIYGACAAWEATLRGQRVALVEQADFGGATSANSLKTIHGGLRYLQHADFKRMRESIRERKALLKIAPHLIHPLPILVPTTGHGLKGREVMTIALAMNDVISGDRNWGISDRDRQLPRGRTLSQADCLALLPGLDPHTVTGAAEFYDAQVYNSERLTLAFLRSAVERGAAIANYAQVTAIQTDRGRVQAVTVRDQLTQQDYQLSAQAVLNTSGPWIRHVAGLAAPQSQVRQGLALAVNLVTRRLFDTHMVGLSSQYDYPDQDAVLKKGSRFLFVSPWRDRSLVGTWYRPYDGDPAAVQVSTPEIQAYLDEINQAYPAAQLSLADVDWVHWGLLPRSGIDPTTGEVQLAKHYQLYDHQADGVSGLLSISGVKYTTARDVATKAVDWVCAYLQQPVRPAASATTLLWGSDTTAISAQLATARQDLPPTIPDTLVTQLVYNYGTAYRDVLQQVELDSAQPGDAPPLTEWDVWAAMVRYAVRVEMAVTLADVVWRRTELGSAGEPSAAMLEHCATVMAAALGWSPEHRQAELDAVRQQFAQRRPVVPTVQPALV